MKMVFVGNCQIAVLFELFRLFSETALDDQMRYLPSYENLSAEGQKDLQQADVIVEQILDLGPRVNVEDHNQHARRVLVPLVACGFLWPFAGQAHPKNTSFGFLPSGPYNAELGDSYLNRLIAAGVEAESAVQQYEGVNINRRVNLDRLREIWIDRQRSRDEICGFNIADHITEHYKLEQLFRTPHHPGLRISRNLFEQAFNHIGASSSDTTRMLASLNRSPFPYDSTPFHPFVVDHFGSEFVGRNQRHPFLTEGTFTFREYAIRYMRFEWNRDLAEGIATAGHADPGLCEAQLRRALEISPGSPTGHFALGKVLAKQERHDEAESQLRHAIALADEKQKRHSGPQ
jgi:tetratricopeptide (TPR) repeat protein